MGPEQVEDTRGQNIESSSPFVPLKLQRKLDSLGTMSYKLRLTNFLRASLVPLGYVPSGASKKKDRQDIIY